MKFNLILIIIFLSVLVFAGTQYSSGIVGLTRLNGNGCVCHSFEPSTSVQVWIEGPDSVFVADTVIFKILMTGGSSVKGGYNVATIYGTLEAIDSFSQTMVYIDTLPSQLAHTFPRTFGNATVYWDFVYIAPDTTVTDTIYSVANSVNDDGNPQEGDEWNFGTNFPVVVIDNPVTVKDNISPIKFSLKQNYPNPFNPSTSIQYTVSTAQFISLKVYDLLGEEIITLVNEEKPIGIYEVDFNAENLPSGIYFYRLQVYPANGGAGEFVEIKKMVLLR